MAQYAPQHKMLGKVYWPDFTPIADRVLRFFVYPADFTLGAFQTFQVPLVVGHESFLWGLTGNSSQGGSFRVLLRDGKTGQYFTQKAVASGSILGTGQDPFFLREIHAIPAMRAIVVQATDTSGAVNNVEVALLVAISDE